MSHEDADAEQDTRCRDELGHSSPPSQGANRAVVCFRMTSSNQENGFAGRDGPVLLDAARAHSADDRGLMRGDIVDHRAKSRAREAARACGP